MERLIAKLNAAGARYLLIGGHAVRLEGMPRFTLDWDLYIPGRDRENLSLINGALAGDLDVELVPLGPNGENFIQTYQTPEGILQFHLAGVGLPPFEDAEQRRVLRRLEGGTPVWCMCAEDLLRAKEAANRPQDAADVLFLRWKLAASRPTAEGANGGGERP